MAEDLVEFLVRQQAKLPHRVVIRLKHNTKERYEHKTTESERDDTYLISTMTESAINIHVVI